VIARVPVRGTHHGSVGRIFLFLLAPSAASRSGSWRRPSEPPRQTSIADEVAGVGREGRATADGVKPGRCGRGEGQPSRGHGQPCALTTLCRAPSQVAHGKEYHRSRACSAAHDREGVTPSPRGRPSTHFLCRASYITHGKERCRALPFPKAHDKGLCRVKMHRAPFVVRLGKMRTAKAVPCVF
jgi:hypothetical protein